jgi:transposase
MAFMIAKEIEAVVGCQVYVLNASRLAVIYCSMKKTDKQDSLKLAHILQDFQEDRLPVVPVPSDKEMDRRKLVAGSRRAQQYRNRSICQLHGLFLAQGITTITKEDLATRENRLEVVKLLTGIELDEASYLLDCLDLFERRIKSLDKKIDEESAGDEQIERLKSIPGVGPKTSFAFVAHVAAERFENASQVSNYLGLVPRVYMSGETVRYGSITKRGNGYVRALLVQASWSLVRSRHGGKLKEKFLYMTQEKSISKKKAIVAVARGLAELMYTLMKNEAEYICKPLIRIKEEVNAKEQLAKCA